MYPESEKTWQPATASTAYNNTNNSSQAENQQNQYNGWNDFKQLLAQKGLGPLQTPVTPQVTSCEPVIRKPG